MFTCWLHASNGAVPLRRSMQWEYGRKLSSLDLEHHPSPVAHDMSEPEFMNGFATRHFELDVASDRLMAHVLESHNAYCEFELDEARHGGSSSSSLREASRTDQSPAGRDCDRPLFDCDRPCTGSESVARPAWTGDGNVSVPDDHLGQASSSKLSPRSSNIVRPTANLAAAGRSSASGSLQFYYGRWHFLDGAWSAGQ
nr:hypothetical protein CFP56_38727 [Quercus suber]